MCVPNKTEDLNLSLFSISTGINESKTLTKHISCECKCKFDRRKCNSNQWWNSNNCRCECKKHHILNPSTCISESRKYLASIMEDSVIICDEIINAKETKTIQKNITCKTQNFYILHAFLSVSITLLIAASTYCYLIKYRAEQKHLLPFYNTNNKLREILF